MTKIHPTPHEATPKTVPPSLLVHEKSVKVISLLYTTAERRLSELIGTSDRSDNRI